MKARATVVVACLVWVCPLWHPVGLAGAAAAMDGPLRGLPLSYYKNETASPARMQVGKFGVFNALPSTVTRIAQDVTKASHYAIDLSTATALTNLSIILENRGTADVVNPWVVVNGQPDWYDASSIAREAVGSETDPKKKAFRIWRFLCDKRRHWYPAESTSECHDLVTYLNVYGYGFCDDTALASGALFARAGLPSSRIWGLEGHVVPEAFYEGDWHMLDSDLETFYPQRDNMTVASVEDCAADGRLVYRVSQNSYLEDLYTSTKDNVPTFVVGIARQTMALTLRPGESLERCWYNWGKYHAFSAYPKDEPPSYGNGRIVYAPDLSSSAYRYGADSFTNLTISGDPPNLHRVSADKPGELVVGLQSPYVFLGGSVDVGVSLSSKADSVRVDFSRDRMVWAALETTTGPLKSVRYINFDNRIAPLSSLAVHTFWLRFALVGDTTRSVALDSLKIVGEIQCAPASLPGLEPAKVNDVSVRMDTRSGASLHVEHLIQNLPNALPAPSASTSPELPLDNAMVTSAPYIAWAEEASSSSLVDHEVEVTWDKEGIVPVVPLLADETGSGDASYALPDGWLLPGKTYYWHVRARDSQGFWGPDSAVWSLHLTRTAGVATPWNLYR